MSGRLSPAALALIVSFEVGGGQTYYERFLVHPTWPQGSSGVTIGVGYDLGYEKHFEEDWQSRLSGQDFARLARCLGKIKQVARQAISGVRDIKVPWKDACEVFEDRTLPQEIRNTLATFPGSADKLTADAFGALVSLVFNRGTQIDDSDRRREMLAIRTRIAASSSTVARPDPALHKAIAADLRSMARLWKDDPDSDGDLHDRRLAEATLVAKSVPA